MRSDEAIAVCRTCQPSAIDRRGMKNRGTYWSIATSTPHSISRERTWPVPYQRTTASIRPPESSMTGK